MHGIEVVQDLPGVGKNLLDHTAFVIEYTATYSSGGMGWHPLVLFKVIRETIKYVFYGGPGLLASNLVSVMACYKSKPGLEMPDVAFICAGGLAAKHAKPFP